MLSEATFSMKENMMKTKRIQRQSGASCRGKGGNNGDKTSAQQSHPGKPKPFVGKVFYLDLPSNRAAETLERDITQLGGTVEKFFSKEIKYLVSNKWEAKYVRCLRQDSPVPSPDSGRSSPHPPPPPPPHSTLHQPGRRGDNAKNKCQGQTDALVPSRGKSLVERVVKEKERAHMNKIFSNALEWGVKILYVDDVLAYVEKKKKMTSASRRSVPAAVKTPVRTQPAAETPFQKCKGGRISKPFVKVEDSSRHYRPIFLSMPNVPELNLKTAPPFSPFSLDDNRQRGHRGVRASASEDRVHGRKKNRDKRRGGYCECCMVKYDNLSAHLLSERHQAFSKSDQYHVVDQLVSDLHCSFTWVRGHVNRLKCGSPGPCGGAELGTPQTGAEAPPSSPRVHRKVARRSRAAASHRSKHSLLARKRLRAHSSERDATPSGELRLTSGRRQRDADASTAHTLHPDSAQTNDKNKDPQPGDGDARARSSSSSSPVPKIRRKVRACRRRRRKVNEVRKVPWQRRTNPGDFCDDAILRLWQIFQSSDDVDVEFVGFDDQGEPMA